MVRRIRVLQLASRAVGPGQFEAIATGVLGRKRLRLEHYNRRRDGRRQQARPDSPRQFSRRQTVTHYSEEFKAGIIARMLAPSNMSVSQLALETGIPKDTLYAWRIKHRKSRVDVSASTVASGGLSSEEKFATLNEIELSEYCRRKGLHPCAAEAGSGHSVVQSPAVIFMVSH